MKFMCMSTIPASVLEGISDGLGLFQALEERGKIGPNNIGFIEELLKATGRGNLASVLRQDGPRNPHLVQSPPPSSYAGKGHSLDYRTILNKIAENLTEQDVRQLVYLFPEINNEQSLEIFRRDRRELMIRMERHMLFSSENLEPLKWALNEIGRKDLSAFVDGANVFGQTFAGAQNDPQIGRYGNQSRYPESVVSRSVSQDINEGYIARSVPQHQDPPNGRMQGYKQPPVVDVVPRYQHSATRNLPHPRSQIGEETQHWEQHNPGYRPRGIVQGHPHFTTEPSNPTERRKGPKVVVPPTYREEMMRQARHMLSGHEQLREERNRFPLNPPDVPSSYDMNCKPHGVAVIFSVDEIMLSPGSFDGPTPPSRRGVAVDRASLETTFKYLGYSVEIYANLTSAELKQTMRRLAARDHSSSDSFVFCFLGCGTNNGVYCNDGEVLSVREISSTLRDSQTLRGKPKMFFFQMSRGSSLDRGTSLPHQSTVTDAGGLVIPSEADFLFAYSTCQGYCAHNDMRRGGSFYITALTDVLTAKANTHDLVTMLTEVSSKMAEIEVGYINRQPVMQIQEVVSRLTKTVWFHPQ
jgi:hypothetical protein